MKFKKTVITFLLVALLNVGMLLSVAATKIDPFTKKDISAWNKIDPATVLKKNGKTLNSEKTLNDVYKKQDKASFLLKYKKTEYFFANLDSKIKLLSITTTDPKIIGPRNTKVGMDVKTLINKFPIENKAISAWLKSNDKVFRANLYDQYGSIDLYNYADIQLGSIYTQNSKYDFVVLYSDVIEVSDEGEDEYGVFARAVYCVKNGKIAEMSIYFYDIVG